MKMVKNITSYLLNLLYADDLVLIAETEDDPIKRLNESNDFVENRGDIKCELSRGCYLGGGA